MRLKRLGGPIKDRTGQRYGKLLVIGLSNITPNINRDSKYWECRCDCGKIIIRNGDDLEASRKNNRISSCKSCCFLYQKQDKSPAWRGGRSHNRKGYILIACPNHPNKDRRGYVLEHVLIMEKKLGRYLLDREIVHHRNGIVWDNRIDNLELRTIWHPKGQSIQDMVAFCKEYLTIYESLV